MTVTSICWGVLLTWTIKHALDMVKSHGFCSSSCSCNVAWCSCSCLSICLSVYLFICVSICLSIYPSLCLSIYLSICKLENEAIPREILNFSTWQHQQRNNSARLLQLLNSTTSKTKQFCETSFKHGKLYHNGKHHYQAYLRHVPQTILQQPARPLAAGNRGELSRPLQDARESPRQLLGALPGELQRVWRDLGHLCSNFFAANGKKCRDKDAKILQTCF